MPSVEFPLDCGAIVKIGGLIDVAIIFETFSFGLDKEMMLTEITAVKFIVGKTCTGREAFEPLVRFRGAFALLLTSVGSITSTIGS